jgi:hypothetical protein
VRFDDPRAGTSTWGLVAVMLAADWVAYGTLGDGQVILVVMTVLLIVLGGAAILLVRTRKSR